ncbi:RagB/SusD family nutrient uptake outer membrane protein [Flavihumibacter petaseus]|uniref:RagB/SusD family nutrient uptake outer membrane protein n=1 Tax=Flavihumibacter petaseus NBRC 106054 TaxID=1220578 RepID=A0A0E9N3E9_9BACT|nr:RagB/SusD family nutrient uptake outer membrane protein [Flavihumibacter petaseus]GAO43865.1 hypothetical protein FPE01S_02_09710 [Flavihumibacter petaseus NBRC 106054]
MKNNISRYTSIVLVAAGLAAGTGCAKKLEQENPNAQTAETFWRNESDAMKGVNASYGSMQVDGTYMRFLPMLLDVRGDDVRSNSPWSQIYNIGRFALGTGIGDGYGWTYESCYQGVFRANQVLENVPEITMDEALKARIIGQAHFLRGFYFFHLVNLFGNVSLPLQSAAKTGQFYVPQSSAADGWNQVIDDLTQAAGLLPVDYNAVDGPDKSQTGRATKGAALAYLGKALLFNHRFAEAGEKFKAVIDLNKYALMPDYKMNFVDDKYYPGAENNVESVFEVQFSTVAGGVDLGWGGAPASAWGKYSARAITCAPRGFGWVDVQPTFSVRDEFLQEKTVDDAVDPRLDATMFYNKPGTSIYGHNFQDFYANSPADLNDLFCRKYQNGDGQRPDEFDWRSGINERIMRYADVLLMYAECLNETGNTTQAAQYMQLVRSRVKLPNREAEFAAMSQDQFRDQLAHERLLEFCLEGHRFDDIRRWGWLQDGSKLSLLKQRDPEFNSYVPGKEVYPIPLIEIQNNPGFIQNPTY